MHTCKCRSRNAESQTYGETEICRQPCRQKMAGRQVGRLRNRNIQTDRKEKKGESRLRQTNYTGKMENQRWREKKRER